MYTRRAVLVTLDPLRRMRRVCGRNHTDFSCAVRIPNFVRNFRAAPERVDAYSNFDGNVDENVAGNSFYNQSGQFYGRNTGGLEPRQNPGRVYEKNIDFNRLNQNHSDHDYGNGNSRFGSNIGGNMLNQNLSLLQRQDSGLQLANGKSQQNDNFYGNGGISEAPPQNHGGGQWENARGFIDQSKFSSSYNGKNDALMQNAHNIGNYQHNSRESRSDGMTDSHVTTDMAMHPGSQESQLTRKVEDLDVFMKEGKLKEAVDLLGLLKMDGVQVDMQRYTALMKVCGENEDLEHAKSVHKHLLKSMVHLETRTYNQILEMYSKCGSMEDAFSVFDQMPRRNLTSWDIMISWLAKNDHGESSLELFAELKRSGLKPDGGIFIGVFSACGVLGDIIEGMLHFESMMKDYCIDPTMEHYVSIVDMLGNAGCLDEAYEFIQKMPVQPSVKIWETLMTSCRIHGNMELGDLCTNLVELLDPSRLNEQSREGLIPISRADLAREKERKKTGGQSLPDLRNRVREYRAGDRSHPNNERIYELLRGLKQQMKEFGYVPEVKFVLHDVDQEVKEEALMAHSERLAAAQGFLTTAPRASLRIIKNLRVCVDCHNAFKIISKISGREIVARDTKRFHHFRDGTCSCNDFW